MNDKVAVIIQARTGSTRLPGKVLADIAGEPMLTFLVKRLRRCTLVDDYILATTISGNDDVLATLGNELDLIVSWERRRCSLEICLQQRRQKHR